MKDFFRLLRRFAWPYKWDVAWSVLFNILSAFLTLFSFAFIIPILQMLFRIDTTHYAYMGMADGSLKEVAVNNFYYYTQQLMEQAGSSATLAALAAALRWVEVLLRPLMLTIKSIPVASFIILALMWLRSAGNLAVFISFLMVLPVVYTNTLAGIRETDARLLEMAAVFRVPPAKRVRYLYVPAALPYFRSACTVGLGLCWKSGVAAEVIGITSGSIGEALYNAKILFSTAELLAWTVVIVLLSLAFERLFLWGLARVESVLLERSGT